MFSRKNSIRFSNNKKKNKKELDKYHGDMAVTAVTAAEAAVVSAKTTATKRNIITMANNYFAVQR